METKYKAILALFLVVVVSGAFFTTVAKKPDRVVEWSNGFPSGPHFNLNIHGKKDTFVCDKEPGNGSSVFVREYGTTTIEIIQNKKSKLDELYVHDACGMSEDDPVKVQLPSGEYQVYARILAKPGKIKNDEERGVVLYPNLIDACNDNETDPIDGFGDYIDCSKESLVGLDIVTENGAFDKDSQEFTRSKGKSKAANITDMFLWSGYACNETYDTNGDGEITVEDVPADLNNDTVIDELDLQLYIEANCVEYNSEWIFNIADLVIYGWDYQNYGAKLVQVRFYPTDTTEFN